MKLKDLFKFFFEIQDIKVYKNGKILFVGPCSKFTNERILEREVKNILTKYDNLDGYNAYIIITIK